MKLCERSVMSNISSIENIHRSSSFGKRTCVQHFKIYNGRLHSPYSRLGLTYIYSKVYL